MLGIFSTPSPPGAPHVSPLLPGNIPSSQVPASQEGGSLWRSSRPPEEVWSSPPELRCFLRTGHCHMPLRLSSYCAENCSGQGSSAPPLPCAGTGPEPGMVLGKVMFP